MASTDRSIDLPSFIANQIREQINRGVLAPGLQLRQMDLAERFDVSRVPVREALKLLAAAGMIEHDPNRGFYVAPLSSDEAEQLYRIRYLLESEVLSTVEWPGPEQLSALSDMVDELNETLEQGDRSGWVEKHRRFHHFIFDLSPHKVLVREVLRLLAITDRYRSLIAAPGAKDARATQEHKLVEALATRDRELLLKVFAQERGSIEEGLLSALMARGL